MHIQIILLTTTTLILSNCQEFTETHSPPFQQTTEQGTILKSSFVLKPVHDESKVPFEHLIVEHPSDGTNLENYNPDKKFVAIPVHSDGGGTVNGIVANLVENEGDDNDDLVTAEAIVFRPLFRYRQQQANRIRYYASSNNCANCNRRSGIERNRNRQRYPDWYHKAEFPALP